MSKHKTYVLYYDFKHTSGNHAGMAYFSQCLARELPGIVLIKHINQEYRGGRFVAYGHTLLIVLYLLIKLRKGDKVLFMEYLSGYFGHQYLIAKLLRFFGQPNSFIGLVHLSGRHLLAIYRSTSLIKKRLYPLTKVVVFGSSLQRFIRQTGYTGPVARTFHYADTSFYTPGPGNNRQNQPLHVLFIGNLLRDFERLNAIVTACGPGIMFHIALGKSVRRMATNEWVKTYGYLAETDLLTLMQSCDVNLAVLEDTVGSNAITGTLATGLIQVVSDVGSIRDYCDDGNSVFCKTTDDFIEALTRLAQSPEKVDEMKRNARKKGLTFSIGESADAFGRLLNT